MLVSKKDAKDVTRAHEGSSFEERLIDVRATTSLEQVEQVLNSI